jgi:hypothetical protein
MYGEEGESEYGGKIDLAERMNCSKEWIINTYFCGSPVEQYKELGFTNEDLLWWQFPSQEELDSFDMNYTHWSYFEDWNSAIHYSQAKRMGFKPITKIDIDEGVSNYANASDYASIDDPYMVALNKYLMFLKFGFGRGTQEGSFDIRANVMELPEALSIANKYDDYDCIHFKDKLLEALHMSLEEWEVIVDKWANREILDNIHGKWKLKKENLKKKEKIVQEYIKSKESI